VYTKYREAVGEREQIESDFYGEGSPNNNLESEI
jgi:hypothetical protein